MYADRLTGSMRRAMDEMNRRREKQLKHNKLHRITPKTVVKAIQELEEFQYKTHEEGLAGLYRGSDFRSASKKELPGVVKELEHQMREAADALDYEMAAVIRDRLFEVREMMVKG